MHLDTYDLLVSIANDISDRSNPGSRKGFLVSRYFRILEYSLLIEADSSPEEGPHTGLREPEITSFIRPSILRETSMVLFV